MAKLAHQQSKIITARGPGLLMERKEHPVEAFAPDWRTLDSANEAVDRSTDRCASRSQGRELLASFRTLKCR